MNKIKIMANPELLQMSLWDVLIQQASARADQPAIFSSPDTYLTYTQLQQRILAYKKLLYKAGLTSTDRIAIVLPNGKVMAEVLLAVMSSASCAPLNPNYHQDDFEFYFRDLGVSAVVIAKDDQHDPAVKAARKMGLQILTPLSDANTMSEIIEPSFIEETLRPVASDIALLLHTSGTTHRPKLVSLTQKNILTSAHNISSTLQLSDHDCSLNMMPLFHIHAIIGSLLATVYSGSHIICLNGYHEKEFFNWLHTKVPTWYSAVPTIHQAILSKVAHYPEQIANHSLRLIRSSSSALLTSVRAAIENAFNVPVIESYGMTEGSQLTSAPMPPQKNKPGSVGLAAGPELAVMNDDGDLLETESIGELVVRGDNVMAGYESNYEANQSSFCRGWFRTGDQGWIDNDGYIYITDRLKEIINRGGEKISPREIDEVVMNHDDVIQAVTYAVPHPFLGEDVAVAVVLKEGATTTSANIRKFLFTQLADFKVPSSVAIVNAIPKGSTGKLQRFGLAEKLAGLQQQVFQPPSSQLELLLAKQWNEILGIKRIGIHDNFFSLGGHSLTATQAVTRINKELGIALPLRLLFEHPSIHELESKITQHQLASNNHQVLSIEPRARRAFRQV